MTVKPSESNKLKLQKQSPKIILIVKRYKLMELKISNLRGKAKIIKEDNDLKKVLKRKKVKTLIDQTKMKKLKIDSI